MSQNWFDPNVGPSPVVGGPATARKFSQIPERSGLPSAVRGAGAFRFGFPSAVFGTPGVGCSGHCAHSVTALANTITKAFIVTDYPAKCALTHRLALLFRAASTTSRSPHRGAPLHRVIVYP